MSEVNQYLQVLIDSLVKKKETLDEIIAITEEQRTLANSSDKLDLDEFRDTMDRKEVCILLLNKLDDGFNSVYNRIRESVFDNKSVYAEEIKTMQTLIDEITDRSVIVQTSERRNKVMIEKQFALMKGEIKSFRKTNQAVAGYYQNMNRMNVESQFLDKKK